MFFKQFIDLGLYKSSCILFSCLFFVSCNTVSHKSTDVASAAGTRNIASASMASLNASAFLVMQDCPVLSSIQSRIRTDRTGGEGVMEMMDEKDSQGRTLTQRLMLELASSSGCFARVRALKQGICSNNAYNELCNNLDQLETLGAETVKKEFKQFLSKTGDNLERLGSSELAEKLGEFARSRDDGGQVSAVLGKISDHLKEHPTIVSIAGLLIVALFGKAVLMAAGSMALGALVVGLKVALAVGVVAVAGWFVIGRN